MVARDVGISDTAQGLLSQPACFCELCGTSFVFVAIKVWSNGESQGLSPQRAQRTPAKYAKEIKPSQCSDTFACR